MTTRQDDPIAKALMGEVHRRLAAGSIADLIEDVEAIDSLDANANPALKVKLDQLRKEVVRRVAEAKQSRPATTSSLRLPTRG